MQWQYRVERWFASDGNGGAVTLAEAGRLAALGDDGWELVASVGDHHPAPDWRENPALVFKRPIGS